MGAGATLPREHHKRHQGQATRRGISPSWPDVGLAGHGVAGGIGGMKPHDFWINCCLRFTAGLPWFR